VSGSSDDAPLRWAVEALLFASGDPVDLRRLAEALDADPNDVEAALRELAAERIGRGVELVEVAGGWQLRTAPRWAAQIARFRAEAPIRPTRAAMEVLAAVAWRQPVTRADIDALRGVDSQGPLRWLLDRDLVRVAGRRQEPGRPLEYGTTDSFLALLGLDSVEDLPAPEPPPSR
jgi:segregation and condensation protein B